MNSNSKLSNAQGKIILNDPLLIKNPLGFDHNLYPFAEDLLYWYGESKANKLPESVVDPLITFVPNKLPGSVEQLLVSGNNAFTSIAPSVDLQSRLKANAATATINLKNTAVDMNTPGYDLLTGAGLIQADAAITFGWDIAPYTPTGWDGSLVISTVAGTNTNTQSITTTDTLYIDFALTNNGYWATDNSFYTTLSIDGGTIKTWYIPAPFYYDQRTGIADYVINPLSAGSHKLTVTLDSSNVINEGSYETNNVFSQVFTVLDTSLPAITVAATDANAAETLAGATANPGSYTLTRSVVTASPLTVNISMSGEAINGTDYTSIPTTVIFAANSSTAIVNLTPINDTLVEQPETAVLTIGAGTGYTIGTTASAIVNIADNDGGQSVITLASNYSGVSEDGTPNLIYTFTRTGATTQALAVKFTAGGKAIRGTDYLASGATISGTNGIINFAAGSKIAKLTVNPSADTIKEANETVVLKLVAGTGYQVGTTTPVTTTIINDDGTLNQLGTQGNDSIKAGLALILSGRDGNDILIGSPTSNILSGSKGADTLTGGGGSDVFLFSAPQEGIDKITDFNPLEDLIQISAAGFGGGLVSGENLSPSQFSLGSVTAATRFIFSTGTGVLYFDSDGSGSAAPIQLASLTSGLALTNENIFVS